MAIEEVTLPLTVAANHFRPWTSRAATVVFSHHRQEAVGGKLTIGRDELTFQPHQFNLQTDIRKWPTAAIEGFEPTNTLGLIPNGIVIHFRNAPSERFVVAKRKQVLTTLSQILTELQHLRRIVDHFRPAPSSPEQRAAELTKEHEQDIVGSWTTDYGGWSPTSENLIVRGDGTGEVSGLSNATFRWAPLESFSMKVWDVRSFGGDSPEFDPREHIVTWTFDVKTMHDGEKVVSLRLSPTGLLVVHSLIC